MSPAPPFQLRPPQALLRARPWMLLRVREPRRAPTAVHQRPCLANPSAAPVSDPQTAALRTLEPGLAFPLGTATPRAEREREPRGKKEKLGRKKERQGRKEEKRSAAAAWTSPSRGGRRSTGAAAAPRARRGGRERQAEETSPPYLDTTPAPRTTMSTPRPGTARHRLAHAPRPTEPEPPRRSHARRAHAPHRPKDHAFWPSPHLEHAHTCPAGRAVRGDHEPCRNAVAWQGKSPFGKFVEHNPSTDLHAAPPRRGLGQAKRPHALADLCTQLACLACQSMRRC